MKAALTIIDALYQRLSHMAMMQVELSRVLVPGLASSSTNGTETLNKKLQRREYLLKTSQLTQRWIQEFKQIWNRE